MLQPAECRTFEPRQLSTIKLWFPSSPNDPNDLSQVHVQYSRTEKTLYDVEVAQTTTRFVVRDGAQRAVPPQTESHLCIHAGAPTRGLATRVSLLFARRIPLL